MITEQLKDIDALCPTRRNAKPGGEAAVKHNVALHVKQNKTEVDKPAGNGSARKLVKRSIHNYLKFGGSTRECCDGQHCTALNQTQRANVQVNVTIIQIAL